MIVVGLLLVVLALLVVAGLVLGTGGSTAVEFFGLILPNLTARTLVLAGVGLGLLTAFGLGLMRGSVSRWRRRRRARRLAAARAPVGGDGLDEDDPFLLGR
jgi:hypothetical protein